MSQTPGSETRLRTELVSTRWSPTELARLDELATHAGCSRAELLRRLVKRGHGGIVQSRELVASVRSVGVSVAEFTRALNAGKPLRRNALDEAYAELLAAVIRLGA